MQFYQQALNEDPEVRRSAAESGPRPDGAGAGRGSALLLAQGHPREARTGADVLRAGDWRSASRGQGPALRRDLAPSTATSRVSVKPVPRSDLRVRRPTPFGLSPAPSGPALRPPCAMRRPPSPLRRRPVLLRPRLSRSLRVRDQSRPTRIGYALQVQVNQNFPVHHEPVFPVCRTSGARDALWEVLFLKFSPTESWRGSATSARRSIIPSANRTAA